MANAKEKKETQHVLVVARLRPFNSAEIECGAKKCLEINGRDINLQMTHGTKRYTFDRVFDMCSKQEDVYNTVISPMIKEIMQGYNCTVFAYGQTGTGKTYTMVGNQAAPKGLCSSDPHIGIIPRTLDNLFTHLSKSADVDFTVRASYLELYNEVLIDLLSCEDKVLKIYEDQKNKGSVRVHGLEEVTVYNKEEVFDILQKGSDKRMTASTLMNTQSSRSHTVFTITLHSRELTPDGEELVKTGKLNLVDLAGSENITKSGAIDKRAREAGSINQSLLTLGRVIKALVENSAHIPYRESKLTRILQDSLGGKTKTAIIATISPASNNFEETMSTLDYAFRARNITNRPEINQRMSKKALIQKYLEEIDRLKKDVQSARTKHGIYLNPENYDMMMKESEKQKETLLKSIEECSIFESRVKELERIRTELEEIYSVTQAELNEATLSLQKSKAFLKTLMKERRIQQELIDKYDEAQTAFHQHSRALSEALDKYMKDKELLTSKVDTLYSIMDKNERTSAEFGITYNNKRKATEECFLSIMEKLKNQSEDIQKDLMSNGEMVDTVFASYGAALDHCQCMIERVRNNTKDLVAEIFSNFSHYFECSNTEYKILLQRSCLSLQVITTRLAHDISVIFDTVATYKKKMLEEQNSVKAEMSTLVTRMDHKAKKDIMQLGKIINEMQSRASASIKERKSFKESTDDIYKTYVEVDTNICDNLDALSAAFTNQIAQLKQNIQHEHRTAMKKTIDQHKTHLTDYDGNWLDFLIKLQVVLKTITSECERMTDQFTGTLKEISTTVVSKSQEDRFNHLVKQVNDLNLLVQTYRKEEERISEDGGELDIKNKVTIQQIQNEQKEIYKSREVTLEVESMKLGDMKTELNESNALVNTHSINLKNKNEELNSMISQNSAEYISEMNELSNSVDELLNTMTFPKRKGDTPKGKHSVISATPKRVSKNILLQFASCHESDEESSTDIQDITF